MAIKKRTFKSLFTQEEIKETVQTIKVEQSKSEHAQESIKIDERPVECKKCGVEFSSNDVLCYECYQFPDRVMVYCPKCLTSNKIKKVMTIVRGRK